MMLRRLLVLIATCIPLAAWGEIGQVKNAEGEVYVLRADQRIAAGPGFKLEASDTIVTGADGKVGMTFIDNARLSAGPGSRIELSRFQFDPTTHKGAFTASVKKGTLAVISGQIAKSHPDAMTVKTPTSVLAVRGTRFLVKVD